MILRALFFIAGISLLALVGVRSRPLANPYWIYYVEVDYQANHSTLYKVSVDGTQRQKLFEQSAILKLEDVSQDGAWFLLSFYDSKTDTQQLYRMRSTGRDIQSLSPDMPYFNCARFSDDGKWVVYEAVGRSGQVELRRMRVDGSEEHFLIETALFSDCQQWHMHGDWLVTQQLDVSKSGSIYRIRLNGSDLMLLNVQNEFSPRLSPDAHWIATRDGAGVVLRSINGQTEYHIPQSDGTNHQFRFSPDSKWLVVQFYDEKNRDFELRVVRLDNLSSLVITEDIDGTPWLPEFLPNAEWVVFMNIQNSMLDVYRVNYDGTDLTRLVAEEGDDWGEAISPDNEWLIVHETRSPNQPSLTVMRSDGTSKKTLTRTLLQQRNVQFVPTINLSWHAEILAGGALGCLGIAVWGMRRRMQ
jgi:Tol biopolymer transport system component